MDVPIKLITKCGCKRIMKFDSSKRYIEILMLEKSNYRLYDLNAPTTEDTIKTRKFEREYRDEAGYLIYREI